MPDVAVPPKPAFDASAGPGAAGWGWHLRLHPDGAGGCIGLWYVSGPQQVFVDEVNEAKAVFKDHVGGPN